MTLEETGPCFEHTFRACRRSCLVQKGLEVVHQKVFTSKIGLDYVTRQLKWAKREARKVPASLLSSALLEHIKALQKVAEDNLDLSGGGIKLGGGGSYCLVARLSANATVNTS